MAIAYEDNGQNLSSETRALVEAEVKRLLTAAYDRASRVLKARGKGPAGYQPPAALTALRYPLRRIPPSSWRAAVLSPASPPSNTPPPMQAHEAELHALATELLDKETLSGAQIQELVTRVQSGKGNAHTV